MHGGARLALATLAVTTIGCSHASSKSDGDLAMGAAVQVEAEGCGQHRAAGGGSFIADQRVMTVAHVVAGSTDVDVILPDGTEKAAQVVAIDRQKDLAVLSVNASTSPLKMGTMRSGTKGSLSVWRDASQVALPFVAVSFVDINANDIDHGGPGLRRGYQLVADVDPGDSGSVLVAGGVAVAVVFARSSTDPHRAWATDITEGRSLLAGATNAPVDTGACP